MTINRRQFITSASATLAAAMVTPAVLARGQSIPSPTSGGGGSGSVPGPVSVTLAIDPTREIAHIPGDFTGLSYESAQMVNPDFFSPQNSELIGLFNRLGARGVLRVGGNTVDFTNWSETGESNPGDRLTIAGPDRSDHGAQFHTIHPDAVRSLAGFLDTTDWTLIWNVNLGRGTARMAAEQAAYVQKTVGSRLIGIQVGNEPDLFANNHTRPAGWGPSDFNREWAEYADAIEAAAPGAPLMGPDIAFNVEWIEAFVAQNARRVRELSGHYYAEGPPTDPRMTIERLLAGSPSLVKSIEEVRGVVARTGKTYRMTETNSCYNGGKPGVSDTLASALWGADYMLQLASAGFTGVNFHGGRDGVYTPISGGPEHGFTARPLYYGMMLAGKFAGTTLVDCSLAASPVNLTAYAAKRSDGGQLVAVFNKDETQEAQVEIPLIAARRQATGWRLTGPQMDARVDVTLAGQTVGRAGEWSPSVQEELLSFGETVTLALPPASGALVFLG